MKLFVVIPILCFAHLVLAQSSQSANLKKISWLEGTWTRTDAEPGRSGSERWTKYSEAEWQGLGVNMKGSDTTFVEKIKLLLKDGNIYYVADVPENQQPVYFKVTTLTNHGFVCENPNHDFPKKIEYSHDGNKMKATISGDGKSIDYLFVKK